MEWQRLGAYTAELCIRGQERLRGELGLWADQEEQASPWIWEHAFLFAWHGLAPSSTLAS